MLANYYRLTKPGIIYGNIITTTAGFLFASKGQAPFVLYLGTVVGTALIIASATVFNNYIDQDIDAVMVRTKKRALVTGQISGRSALVFASILGLLGVLTLDVYVNLITVLVGLIGFLDYVVLYTMYKRSSVHGTLVGSVSGAMPLVAGYTAVTDHLDVTALILFLIMVFWQMPHFYAIAMYRYDDYKAAGIPVLPVVKGMKAARFQIMVYIILFTLATIMLWVLGKAGIIYLVIVVLMGASWIWMGARGIKTGDDKLWGKKMFRYSLLIIMLLSLILAVGSVLA